MWYVIQTRTGQEQEVCAWINTHVDKNSYKRCFVPLFEDVWRREGIGHINVKTMFPGYVFLETDTPRQVYQELKALPKMSSVLYIEEGEEKAFASLYPEEEQFFDSILSDGMLRVSYLELNHSRKIVRVIGPLAQYRDQIVRMDIPHRRAIVELPMLGEIRRVKFCLWMDKDPKIDWIEQAKQEQKTKDHSDQSGQEPANTWDWKAWQKINAARKDKVVEAELYGYQVGDYVINTTGIYGDIPLEVVKINPGKRTVTVSMLLFGNTTNVEMGMDCVVRRDAHN